MNRYKALPLATDFWLPQTDYTKEIVHALQGKLLDGDFVVVSEKAISTAKGNMLDETTFTPSSTAKFLATVWMPIVWGYFLGVLCGFGQRLLKRLRNYPAVSGSYHKEVALQYGGFCQALLFGSEGGVDGSNLPYSLVSLPLSNAYEEAEKLHRAICASLGKNVTVVIVDTDKTYSLRNFHFTPRPAPMSGIQSRGSVVAYLLGRVLKLRRRPTPLAVAGSFLAVGDALTVANVADRARGPGSGATVWDMAARFKVASTEVTWDMLCKVTHKPIVIVRKTANQYAFPSSQC
jgi:F420-0:gamma-glutamyl ligase-like protein